MATIEGLLSSPSLLRTMSYRSSTSPPPFLRLRLTVGSPISQPKLLHCKNKQLHHNHWILSASKKNSAKAKTDDTSDGENVDSSSKKNKKPTRRGRKKSSKGTKEENIPVEGTSELTMEEKNTETMGPKKDIGPFFIKLFKLFRSSEDEGETEVENTGLRRGPIRKPDLTWLKQSIDAVPEDKYVPGCKEHFSQQLKPDYFAAAVKILKEKRKQLKPRKAFIRTKDPFGIIWPTLVMCFGPAKASFIPYARPDYRIRDVELHKRGSESYWKPDRFFRAPGSAASSVAIQLAQFDGQEVGFMGKVGLDLLGRDLLWELDANYVQLRCVRLDDSVATAVSRMKLIADGDSLKAQCVQPCAEDSFFTSEVVLHYLKEVKMLYFNSSALLDPNSKSTLMEVIKIMKSQGSLIFFDLNLPLVLWHSPEETKSLLNESLAVANFIEMTQQELNFLLGIKQNIMGNEDHVEFAPTSPEEVKKVWHDGLEVLFVTNGLSMLTYYTKENSGYHIGFENLPIKPSGCEMSVAGDAIVAALMNMLVKHPDYATDPSYLGECLERARESGLVAHFRSLNEDEDRYGVKPSNEDEDEQSETTDEEDTDEESYQDRGESL